MAAKAGVQGEVQSNSSNVGLICRWVVLEALGLDELTRERGG